MFNRIYEYFFSSPKLNAQQETFQPHPSWALLNQQKRELDRRDEFGNTQLMMAVADNHIGLVNDLLNRGANIEARGNNGFTALAVAGYTGRAEIASLLIARHARLEVWTQGEAPNTPLGWAIAHGHDEVAAVLVSAGARLPAGYRSEPEAEVTPTTPAAMPAQVSSLDLDDEEDEFFEQFIDPVSQDRLEDAIALPNGQTYSRESLRQLFESQGYPDTVPCPLTRQPIPIEVLTWEPNVLIKQVIDEREAQWVVKKREREVSASSTVAARPQDAGEGVNAKRLRYYEGQGLFTSPQATREASQELRGQAEYGRIFTP